MDKLAEIFRSQAPSRRHGAGKWAGRRFYAVLGVRFVDRSIGRRGGGMDYRVALGFGRVEMKADQIRLMSLFDFKDATAATVCFLQEIAAQLADLNEHFRLVDESVFGAKK